MVKGKHITDNHPTIGLVSLSAPDAVWNPELYEKGKKALEDRGIKIVEGATVHSRYLYLAGEPQKIADDLYSLFLNDQIDAIMCIGGGNCMNKIVPYIDLELIKQHYKPFIGISNITALMLAMLEAEIVSFHGPFALWSYGLDGTPTDYTHNNWLDILNGYSGKLPAKTKWKTFQEGSATGTALGGNISTISTIVGTKYCPAELFDGSILFIEDVDEDLDVLDARLTHLKLLGVFDKVRGVVVGKLNDCNPPEETKMDITDFFKLVFAGYKFPVIYDCDFGHVADNLCIPFGCMVKIDATENPEITLLEKGVD